MAVGAITVRPIHIAVGVLCAFFLLLAAGPAAQGAEAASACKKWGSKESNEITVGHARKAVLCLVNQERDQHGVPDLHRDERLQRAAQNHNDYMQNHRCFSHECAGERTLDSRLRNVGYITSGLSRWGYGENIAWGAQHLATPRSIVNAWMRSSGHRANILNPAFRDFGVGYTKGTPYAKNANGAIFTTDFGLRVG